MNLSNLRAPKKANTEQKACRPWYGLRHGQDIDPWTQGTTLPFGFEHDARL